MGDRKRRVKVPPRRIYLTFDLLGDPMFVHRNARKAARDAAHYGSTWAGPYVIAAQPEGASK